jgi:hypothetical protein
VRREVIAARGVVTILLIFNSLLYDHLNAINFQINESHVGHGFKIGQSCS